MAFYFILSHLAFVRTLVNSSDQGPQIVTQRCFFFHIIQVVIFHFPRNVLEFLCINIHISIRGSIIIQVNNLMTVYPPYFDIASILLTTLLIVSWKPTSRWIKAKIVMHYRTFQALHSFFERFSPSMNSNSRLLCTFSSFSQIRHLLIMRICFHPGQSADNNAEITNNCLDCRRPFAHNILYVYKTRGQYGLLRVLSESLYQSRWIGSSWSYICSWCPE